jgi:predicted dehydrogenase
MAKRWRVGILGLGHWYSAFGLARGLPEYEPAELVGVAWHDARQLEAFSTAFRVPGYREYDELLARPDIDIIQIAAPVAEIPSLTIAAARAGKHIIVGKPIAMTVRQADEMAAAVREASVACVAFQGMMRLRAGALKERLDRGELGELAVMHQTSRWSIAEDWFESGTPGWFADPAQVPGGALIDEGIYWIDLFRWLAGSEIVTVEARTANLVHKQLAVEDWGMATFTFANGIVATLEASWTINAPRATGPSPKQNAVVRLEIIGTRGEYVDQWFRDPGRAVLAAGADNWIFERQAQAPFTAATPLPLAHLVECLETNRASPASLEEARTSLAVALAAYESARTGLPVHLTGTGPELEIRNAK